MRLAAARTYDVTDELEQLYRTRFADYLRVARAITRDDARAHDVVQEAFARALRGRASFRGEAPLEAWVWGILVNVARASTRVVPLAPAAPEPRDDEHTDSSFRSFVAGLPERQRLVVFLRYWADLDYRGIAHALGIEVGTVSATLNAAHAALRRALEEVS
jgi:RNA polymerase sigma-70 factor (ECF subfamily)